MSKEIIKQYFLLCAAKSSKKIHPLNSVTNIENILKKDIDVFVKKIQNNVYVNENIIGGNKCIIIQ